MAVFSLGEEIKDLAEIAKLLEAKNLPLSFEVTGSHFLDQFDEYKTFSSHFQIKGLNKPFDMSILKQLDQYTEDQYEEFINSVFKIIKTAIRFNIEYIVFNSGILNPNKAPAHTFASGRLVEFFNRLIKQFPGLQMYLNVSQTHLMNDLELAQSAIFLNNLIASDQLNIRFNTLLNNKQFDFNTVNRQCAFNIEQIRLMLELDFDKTQFFDLIKKLKASFYKGSIIFSGHESSLQETVQLIEEIIQLYTDTKIS